MDVSRYTFTNKILTNAIPVGKETGGCGIYRSIFILWVVEKEI
jgi:hypothetical protein